GWCSDAVNVPCAEWVRVCRDCDPDPVYVVRVEYWGEPELRSSVEGYLGVAHSDLERAAEVGEEPEIGELECWFHNRSARVVDCSGEVDHLHNVLRACS